LSAGIQITKSEINLRGGAIAKAVFAVLRDVAQYKAWLDGLSGQNLVDQYTFTIDDANDLKSAYTDLGVIVAVFEGTAAATQSDRRVFARRLIGTGNY
jgi:hypothetical protein